MGVPIGNASFWVSRCVTFLGRAGSAVSVAPASYTPHLWAGPSSPQSYQRLSAGVILRLHNLKGARTKKLGCSFRDLFCVPVFRQARNIPVPGRASLDQSTSTCRVAEGHRRVPSKQKTIAHAPRTRAGGTRAAKKNTNISSTV